jgi:hypothetical protein
MTDFSQCWRDRIMPHESDVLRRCCSNDIQALRNAK